LTDARTLSVYAEKAADYAAVTQVFNESDPILTDFIAALPKGGRVLDLGCGPGTAAARMARAGLDVDAFDPVAEMVAMACQHPGVRVRKAGFDDLAAIDAYDGIWANFSLLHAARDAMPGHLARIAAALRPGGRFHIALKTGTGSARDRFGRFYTYYSAEELARLMADAGLHVTDRRDGCDPGLSGTAERWIALAATRG
jgi:SAM-dependent methyltransferase